VVRALLGIVAVGVVALSASLGSGGPDDRAAGAAATTPVRDPPVASPPWRGRG